MYSTLKEMQKQNENASKSIQIASDSLRLSQNQMILQNRPLVFRIPENRTWDEVDLAKSDSSVVGIAGIGDNNNHKRKLNEWFSITNSGKLPAFNLRKRYIIIKKTTEHLDIKFDEYIQEKLKDQKFEQMVSLMPSEIKQINFTYEYPLDKSFAIFSFEYEYLNKKGRYTVILEFDKHWNVIYESID